MAKKPAAPAIEEQVSNVEMIEGAPVREDASEVEEINQDDPRAAIYAKRDEQIKQQAGDSEPNDAAAATAAADAKPADAEVTVIVNGKEKLVAQSRIDAAGGITAYQKTAAASEMLNQASAELRQAREHVAQIQERERQLAEREQKIQSERVAEPSTPDALEQIAREYHEALMDGDSDKASKLFIQMQTTRNATVNKEEIVNEVVQRTNAEIEREQQAKARQRFAAEVQEANLDYRERFPDIADDPELSSMANQKTIALQEAHPDWSPKVIIAEAAQSVRKWITERTAISSSEQKLAIKRSLDNTRGGSVRAVSRPAPAPQTNSDYVSMVRKQRGLE